MKDDTNNYKSIFFSKLEAIEQISEKGQNLIDNLTEEKYNLFESTIEDQSIVLYGVKTARIDSTIIRIKEEQLTTVGYNLSHKFMAKESTGCRVYYNVDYQLNLQLEVIESNSERQIDCANADF